MSNQSVPFQEYLKQEVERVNGVYYPVRASFLRRVLVKNANCRKLHPNPEDEFCFPDIGPNYQIISKYEKEFKRDQTRGTVDNVLESGIHDPLIVQKTLPDGYMLMNGHHRWAAAMRIGKKRVKIKIVNLTQDGDIRAMLQRSSSDVRVTLDLDEVVFGAEGDAALEKPLRFPLNRFYKERVRLGIPALFHFLNERGYDIWVYTSKYYSMEYIRSFFRHLHVRLTGIVTGAGRKVPRRLGSAESMNKLIEKKYPTTFHIDRAAVMRVTGETKACDEVRLSGDASTWSREVMDAIGALTKHE